MTFDGLLRMLSSGAGTAKPDDCTLAALRLPQCVVSGKCSAALRPTGAAKCRTCADDTTCTAVWGMKGARCDNRWSEVSGWQCYTAVPGTIAGLLYGPSGGPVAFSPPNLSRGLGKALNSSAATLQRTSRR